MVFLLGLKIWLSSSSTALRSHIVNDKEFHPESMDTAGDREFNGHAIL